MSKQLEWKTEQRKVNDLVPNEINPRTITEEKKAQLIQFIQKFNVVEIPVINKDGKLITWNQRLASMKLLGRGEELVDVRVPNRKLSPAEIKEYTLLGNIHQGEWAADILQEHFSDIDFKGLGLDIEFPGTDDKSEFEKEFTPTQEWYINIKCTSEEQTQELYERFRSEGLEVKIVQ
jgi:hypothetical protein